MTTSDLFQIKRLVLIGFRKNYEIPFFPGVNIIYGDGDTGKSSIVRIINYLLGGKAVHLDQEIQGSADHAVLEVATKSSTFCIRRDLYNSSKLIEVFPCEYHQLSEFFPRKYAPSFVNASDETPSVSSFFFEELNLAPVNIKQAPTKDDSPTARLSFRDILKYCYLNQDSVGSRKMLDIGNFPLEVKNREVFKYIFNVLDGNIADIEKEISLKTKEKQEFVSRAAVISNFLDETEFESTEELNKELDNLEEDQKLVANQIQDLDSRITNSSESYEALKNTLDRINLSVSDTESMIGIKGRNIERFGRLRNEYLNDIARFKSIQKSRELIGQENATTSSCPICDAPLNVEDIQGHFEITDDDKVNSELNSLNRRSREIEKLLSEERVEIEHLSARLFKLKEEQERAKDMIDEEMKASISPYLAERDAMIRAQTSLAEKRTNFRQQIKVSNQYKKILERITGLETTIQELKTKLERLQKDVPSLDDVLSKLAGFLNTYLSSIKIKNQVGVGIHPKTFLPVLRDEEYRDVNSGGMRTILSIGYLAAFLRYALDESINMPSLLMVDTVGKYIGKTHDSEGDRSDTDVDEDKREGVSDPDKYKNIYEYLIDLSGDYQGQGKECQIILVDNDVPPEVEREYGGFIVAHYSSKGLNGLPTGLIDDWDDYISQSKL